MEITFKQTPNYSTSTVKKIGYVFHGTLGSYKSAIDWLTTSAADRSKRTGKVESASSCHFIIGRNPGEVTQIGHVKDVTWHAGNISNPAPRFASVMPKKMDGNFENPNKYFVGIEFAWGYDLDGDKKITAFDKTLTDWQYECVNKIIDMYQAEIPFNPKYVFSHHEIASYKSDDMTFAVNKVIASRSNPDELTTLQVKKSQLDKVLAFIKTLN